MKKLLGIVVLGLLFCNVSYSETKKLDEELSLSNLEGVTNVNTNEIDDRDIFLQDNSESEILEALKDYLNYLEGSKKYSPEQLTYNENQKKWLYDTLINNKDLKIHYSPKSKYNFTRIRLIALSTTSGTMAQSFLNKYWD